MSKRNFVLIFLISYLIALTFFCQAVIKSNLKGQALTMACLKSTLPSAEFTLLENNERSDNEKAVEKKRSPKEEKKTPPRRCKSVDYKNPKVLIYHTHGTESYLPSSAGNYHTRKQKNTVRDAGNELVQVLADEGISAIQETSIHDDPTYNGAYSRSYVVAKALLKKYPSIECVIDLHRDALPSSMEGKTKMVNGKKCAAYSYVIATNVPTYGQNKSFIRKLNQIGAEKYSGFTGKILERNYTYNQDLSSKYMLLEVGSNRNHISQVKNTVHTFGKILGEALRE